MLPYPRLTPHSSEERRQIQTSRPPNDSQPATIKRQNREDGALDSDTSQHGADYQLQSALGDLLEQLLELSALLGVEQVAAATEVLLIDKDVGHSPLAGLVEQVSLSLPTPHSKSISTSVLSFPSFLFRSLSPSIPTSSASSVWTDETSKSFVLVRTWMSLPSDPIWSSSRMPTFDLSRPSLSMTLLAWEQ